MKSHHLILPLMALAVPLAAQTRKPNFVFVYDGSVEYTSRGNIGSAEGEILNRMHGGFFGNFRTATAMNFTLQDQNNATAETYWVVIRKSDGKGKPDIRVDPSTGKDLGLLFIQGPYTWSGTGSGGVSVKTLTINFKKPQPLPEGEFFYGLKLGKVSSAGGGWSKDGGSSWISGMYPNLNGSPNPGACGEHARKGVIPHMAWNVAYTSGKPSSTSEPFGNRTWNFKLFVDTPVLQAFAVDPAGPPFNGGCSSKKNMKDFGFAAIWPDLVDLEKYGYKALFGWRIREFNAPNGAGLVFLSSSRLPLPITLPFGKWYLNPGDRWFRILGGFSATLNLTGEGDTISLNPPDPARYAMLGLTLYAQAVVVSSSSKVGITNWTGTSF